MNIEITHDDDGWKAKHENYPHLSGRGHSVHAAVRDLFDRLLLAAVTVQESQSKIKAG